MVRHLALLVVLALPARAQVEGLLQVGDAPSQWLLRQQTLGRLPEAHLGAQPLAAYQARRWLDTLARHPEWLTATDQRLLARWRGETPPPAALQRWGLYRDGLSFFSAAGDGYRLVAEPLLYLEYGRAARADSGAVAVWQNTRGARVAGHVGPHLFFEARVEENQRRVVWPRAARKTAPRLNAVKAPRYGVYDYLVGTGVLGFRSRFFEARLGRDRNRWGYGTGSLVLSNYAGPYDQLQLRAQFWRLHYTSLYAEFTERAEPGSDQLRQRKYGAFHRLALALPGRVEVELFEQVVFAQDTTGRGRRRGFDFAYLNPVVLYRAVEADLGSGDNVLLGGGVAWTAAPGLRLYAQGLLDELTVGRFRDDYWGNKWGFVLGAAVADPPLPGLGRVEGLDLRLEYARLRPFLYSHRSEASAHTHSGDALGHPAGPNAWDLAGSARYRPSVRVAAALDVAYTVRGRSPDGANFGDDPLASYDTRPRERDLTGTPTLQGVRQRLWLVEARLGYELLPALFLEGTLRAESVWDAERGRTGYVASAAALRWGLPFRSERY